MELGCITRSLIPVYLTKNKFAGMLQRSLWPQPGCSASNVYSKWCTVCIISQYNGQMYVYITTETHLEKYNNKYSEGSDCKSNGITVTKEKNYNSYSLALPVFNINKIVNDNLNTYNLLWINYKKKKHCPRTHKSLHTVSNTVKIFYF